MESRRGPPPGRGAVRQDPLEGETHARVLDHQPDAGGGLIQAVTEQQLQLVKLRARPGQPTLAPGDRLYVGPEEAQRTAISASLGMLRQRDLSARSQAEVADVISALLRDTPERVLAFYSRAGNLSLKMHAFQLLKGIGASKAREMVQAREQHGRAGWPDLDAVDADCHIDCTQLLAERFVEEMTDGNLEPRLLDLLIRTEPTA